MAPLQAELDHAVGALAADVLKARPVDRPETAPSVRAAVPERDALDHLIDSSEENQ